MRNETDFYERKEISLHGWCFTMIVTFIPLYIIARRKFLGYQCDFLTRNHLIASTILCNLPMTCSYSIWVHNKTRLLMINWRYKLTFCVIYMYWYLFDLQLRIYERTLVYNVESFLCLQLIDKQHGTLRVCNSSHAHELVH